MLIFAGCLDFIIKPTVCLKINETFSNYGSNPPNISVRRTHCNSELVVVGVPLQPHRATMSLAPEGQTKLSVALWEKPKTNRAYQQPSLLLLFRRIPLSTLLSQRGSGNGAFHPYRSLIRPTDRCVTVMIMLMPRWVFWWLCLNMGRGLITYKLWKIIDSIWGFG